MYEIPIGLQMYTIRDEAERDFRGALRAVAAMGYHGVELAGNGGLSAADLHAALAELGLSVYGSHVGLDALEGNLPAVLTYHKEIGCEYLVCPWLPESRRADAASYRRLGGVLTGIGRACAEAGLRLCHHNHAFEFQLFDGCYGLDILLDTASPEFVQVELDLYWVKHAGLDPVAYLAKLKGRCPLLHLKDMGEDGDFAEVGTGTLDWRGILSAAVQVGVRYLVVEQDSCRRPSLEAARISLENLREMSRAR